MAKLKSTSNSEESDSSCPDCDNISCNYSDESQILLNFEVTNEILRVMSECIYGYWKDIGRRLYVRECGIEEIDVDYNEAGNKEKAYQVLLMWKRGMGKSATMEELQNVLIEIGRTDIAEVISSLIKKKRPAEKNKKILMDTKSTSERTKSEIESHIKLQKLALQKLNRSFKFYQEKVNEIKEISGKDLQEEEARQLQENLRELNDLQSKLDHSQKQLVKSMHKSNAGHAELDENLGDIAKRLFKVEQTVSQYEEFLAMHKCTFRGFLCHFGVKLPRGSTSKKFLKTEEECDDVFESGDQVSGSGMPAEFKSTKHESPAAAERHVRFRLTKDNESHNDKDRISQDRRNSEEMHVRRKLNVSTLSTDEQFQLQEYVLSITPRKYHERKPFIFSHSCMNLQYLQQDSHVETLSTSTCYESPYGIQTWYI